MNATITIEYIDAKTAKAVANAVSPDNLKTPIGLKVNTVNDNCQVVTDIECTGKIATFIATIDDLLFSAIIAEKTLQTIK
ncbi:MAG: KEOPS complex subunit [Nitrososphaerota archaeon]|nr:KEOPS complex subunit [Nitrososphaerota archaeon]